MLLKILNMCYSVEWKGKASLFYAIHAETFIQRFSIFI